jgi:hypothetical protein
MFGTTYHAHRHVSHLAFTANYVLRARRSWTMRLARMTDRRGENECWPWRGYVDPHGQPKLKMGKSYTSAHRLAYEIVHGLIGRKALRWTCGDGPCMNPAHMEVGGKPRPRPSLLLVGIEHDLRLIRSLGLTPKQCATVLEVSRATVNRAIRAYSC